MTDAPLAARARRPGWRDPRLWIGVALVAASVVAGARLLGGADDTIEIWAAGDDLAPGQQLAESDLMVQRVHFAHDEDAAPYLRVADGVPDDATVNRAVGPGELVPSAALGDPPDGRLEVPIWAPDVAVPDSIRPGSVVDVWVTPTGGGRKAGAVLVLHDVVVIAAPRGQGSFSPGGDRQVLVGVDESDARGVGLALAAAKDNRVAITAQG